MAPIILFLTVCIPLLPLDGAMLAAPSSLRHQQSGDPPQPKPAPELVEAQQLSSQVFALAQEGKYDKALPLARKVLTIRESALGPDHPLVAVALRDLSELLLAKGEIKEARPLYERFVTIYEKTFGGRDSKVVEALDRYVCFMVRLGERERALEAQKRLYKADNGFDYDESATLPGKNLVAGGLMNGKAIRVPPPSYSAVANSARLSGSVVMKVMVDESGKVVAVSTLCGHPILAKGAGEAIRKAQYAPTLVNGRPVQVKGIAIINFVRQ